MDDLTRTRMWIDTVPPLDPDTREVILDLDRTSTDPAERLVHQLLDRGHEGEAGVFYLLPDDLAASYGRTGDRLTVTVSTHRDVLTRDLDAYGDELRPAVDGLLRAPHDGEHIVLLRRETVTDFVPAEQDGQPQPVLLIEHAGGRSTRPSWSACSRTARPVSRSSTPYRQGLPQARSSPIRQAPPDAVLPGRRRLPCPAQPPAGELRRRGGHRWRVERRGRAGRQRRRTGHRRRSAVSPARTAAGGPGAVGPALWQGQGRHVRYGR